MAEKSRSVSARLTRPALVSAWVDVCGQPPPKGISSRLLKLAHEYHCQVQEHGGLKKSRLRKLLAYSSKGNERTGSRKQPTTSKKPAAGTRLVRQWRGRNHVVEILDGSVLYQDKTYRSLSQAARKITGARWSGPRFFGLSAP